MQRSIGDAALEGRRVEQPPQLTHQTDEVFGARSAVMQPSSPVS